MKSLLLFVLLFVPVAPPGQTHVCSFRPPFVRIDLPKPDSTWVSIEEVDGSCENLPDAAWTMFAGKEFCLYVTSDGPNGSGRFWTISVGLSSVEQHYPTRGICFNTTTIGWRTLQTFDQVPLMWLNDEDDDGTPELIIWDSFPLAEEPTSADYALVAWVYRVNASGVFRIDWDLSRRKAAEISVAYRKAPESRDPRLEQLRSIAAEALEAFADGRCRPVNEQDREDMNYEGREEP